jgi:hypothetical protein
MSYQGAGALEEGRTAAFALDGAIARRDVDARAPNAMTATNAARPRRAYGGSLNFKGAQILSRPKPNFPPLGEISTVEPSAAPDGPLR